MNLSVLYEKRAKAWETAKNFLDAHTDANGTMTAEDAATYDRMEAEVVDLGKQIERETRAQELENALRQPTSKPIVNSPEQHQEKGTKNAEYGKAFWNRMRSKVVPYEVINALQVGTNSEGGYLVPDEFERNLIQALEEENIIRPLAHNIKTASGDHKIPVVASHGTASWVDEEGATTPSDEVFGQVTIGAFKLATMIKISEELLNDSAFDLPSYMVKEFARRIGAAEEDAFLNGDGDGKPTGLLNATGGAGVGVTAAAADKITMDEVIDLFYSLKAPYRRKAVFIMNDATVKAIRKLKDGQGQYLWQPAVTAGQPDTLLNRPVLTSGYMPAIATGKKTILFGDLGYYWVADRTGRVFKRLDELYAVNGQVGFRAYERVDGKLILAEAVKTLVQA